MPNKWFTYGFLGLMVSALITLAVLQYRWLGSISEAEKQRLEESISASSENFSADFNRVFSDLSQTFRIQVTDSYDDIAPLLARSYQTWLGTSEYPGLIDSVYLVRKQEVGDPKVFLFTSDPVQLMPVDENDIMESWVLENSDHKFFSWNSFPEFGQHSFITIPVQLLDVIQIDNIDKAKQIEVRLNVDQLDDVVLLKLDDNLIKKKIIPDKARKYFSDSYSDQYRLSIVKGLDDQTEIYFDSEGDSVFDRKPDFRSNLNRAGLGNLLMLSKATEGLGNWHVRDSASSAFAMSFQTKMESTDSTGEEFPFRVRKGNSNMSFYSEEITSNQIDSSENRKIIKDSSSNTSVFASIGGDSVWQLWLNFKEGSLDAFVSKTRNRNLIISFGILFILGVSGAMIVIFSARSRDLAEQQMLFVAGVSHELRTPLSVIRSAAENLNEGVVQSEERKKEYAYLMLKEGRRLSDMVDQIMEYSGIQTGKRVYSFSDIDVNELIHDLMNEFRSVLEESGIQLEYSNVTKVKNIRADYEALYLSISNMLTNAIKFSGESKTIRLAVSDVQGAKQLHMLLISVKDEGTGIPEDEQARVFKPFFRGKRPIEEQLKGNGIGLSLVQKVAKAHRGEVRLSSKVNVGTTISLLIPVNHG